MGYVPRIVQKLKVSPLLLVGARAIKGSLFLSL